MGAKNTHGKEWEQLQAEFEKRLERMTRQARREAWLKPQAVYGYWPCQADGDSLILYDYDQDLAKPNLNDIEARFTFRASREASGCAWRIILPRLILGRWIWWLCRW